MKNALRKDFIREIAGNKGRFLSIFLIVLLGAAFFSGIRSTGGQMKYSGDVCYDQTKMMDIRVLSTLGLTDDDLDAIRQVEGVSQVVGGCTKEVLIPTRDQQYAVKLIAQTDEVNQTIIREGRSPQRRDECIMDTKLAEMLECSLGDTIRLSSGTEDSLSDSLTETAFTVVGFGSLPYYLDLTRGVGTIGDGTLTGFLVVPPEVFDTDIYTEAYVRIDGAAELNTYSDAYKDLSKAVTDRIEVISEKERQRRYDEIYSEGNDQIEEGKQEIADAEKELADAKAELDDGRAELDDAKAELADGETKLTDAEAELDDGWQQLEDARKELETGAAQLADAKAELDNGWQQLEDARKELETGAAQLADAKAELDAGAVQLADSKAQLDAGAAELEQSEAQIADGERQLAEGKAQLDAVGAQLEEAEAQLEAGSALLEAAQAALTRIRTELDRGWQGYEAQKQNLILGGMTEEQAEALLAVVRVPLEAGESGYAASLAQYEAQKAQQEEGRAQYEAGRAQYEAGLAEYESQRAALEAGKAQLEAGRAEYEAGKKQYEEGLAQYEAGKKQYEEGLAQYETGKKQYEEGLAEYEAGKRQYEEGLAEYEDGKRQYEEALAEYQDGRKEYEDAVKDYEDGLEKYNDGLKEWEDGNREYQDAYADAQSEIAKAKVDISKAEKDLAELGVPTWYILDREKISSCVSYGMDAERMDSLGNVFPVIFFLVAALVSLTAMTRMVEEQRQQIGTLKALGYSNGAVAGKYFGYAMLATISGAVLGVFIGEKFLPWVIISSYCTLYTGLPEILQPMDWVQGSLAIVLSVACTGIATLSACYRKLKDKPAELMRPEAPKSGKRILLERISFLWKRLNFTQKSTLRNLFRYKKRFIMTIIGIGGCMGLMLVGFGIRDSITVVAQRQYVEIFMQDATVSVDTDASEAEHRALMETIESYPDLTEYMDAYEMSVTLNASGTDRSAYLYVPSDVDHVFDYVRFRDRVTGESRGYPSEGVTLAEKTANMLGVSVGDTITIQKGEKDPKVPVKVEGIVENYVLHYAFMTPETHMRLFGEEPEYNYIYLKYSDNSEEAEKRLGTSLMACDACTGISFVTDLEQDIVDMLEVLNLVIWVLIGAAAILSFVVLYNLNSINMTERKRELATLKVLGFYDMEVAMYVYRENIILTLIGIAAGAVLGTILHLFTILTVEVDLMMFGRVIGWESYLICAVLTFGFSMLVNLVMYYHFKKIDMVESLKSVE